MPPVKLLQLLPIALWFSVFHANGALPLLQTSEKLQAPFDAFVCFNTTFHACLDQAQTGNLRALQRDSFVRADGTLSLDGPTAPAAASTSGVNHYSCVYGSVPYGSKMNQDQTAPAIFVSPVLLRQVADLKIVVAHARDLCTRLVFEYEYQVKVFDAQDALASAQTSVAYLQAEVELNSNQSSAANPSIGLRYLKGDEAKHFNVVDGSSVRDALAQNLRLASNYGEQLRLMAKQQTLNVEFQKQFLDANLNIDLALRELARNLFILDRSVAPQTANGMRQNGYPTGAWVRQGTIVLIRP